MKGHFDMKDQGNITNYLGINVQWASMSNDWPMVMSSFLSCT
jgi:hypothetical protein